MVEEHKRMRQLQATEAEWIATDPVLLEAEIAFSSDRQQYKVGDGVSNWSTLPYWSIPDAPNDGLTHGRKDGNWKTVPEYAPSYTGDLNAYNVPGSAPSFVKLGPNNANAWDGGGNDGDYMIHFPGDGVNDCIQIGLNWTQGAGSGSSIIKTRRQSGGVWSGWLTNRVFSEEVYSGDLLSLFNGDQSYQLDGMINSQTANAWPGAAFGDSVTITNQDADTAQMIGWDFNNKTVWLRDKQGGVWGDWVQITGTEAGIFDLDRVRWRGNWVDGSTYLRNDAVLRYPYLRIANQETTEDPGTTPLSTPQWDLPDSPAWTNGQFTGVVWSGHEYEVRVAVDIQSYAIWAPTLTADTNYNIRVYNYPVGNPDQIEYSTIAEPVLTEDGWTVVAAGSRLYLPGTVIGVIIDALNSGDQSQVTGGWTRNANSNNAAPTAQGWITNNAETRVGVHFTDLDDIDRQNQLEGIVAGSTITIVQTDEPSKSMTWTVNAAPTTQANHVEFDSVTYDGPGATGVPDIGAVCTFTADIPVLSPTDYVQMVDHWTTNPVTWANVTGILRLGGVDQTGVENDAFGVRIYGNMVSISDHWDTMAISGGAASTGDSGGGASSFTDLSDTPTNYSGHEGKTVAVKSDASGLEFVAGGGSDYVPISGGTFTGSVTFNALASFLAGLGIERAGQDMIYFRNTTSGNANYHVLRADNGGDITIFHGGANAIAARIDVNGTSAPSPQTVMTREKADARYGGVGYDSGWLTTWALPYTHPHTLGAAPMRYEFWLRAKSGNTGGWPTGAIMAGVPSMDGDGARHRGSYATATDVIRMGAFQMTNANNVLSGVTDTDAELRILLWADP